MIKKNRNGSFDIKVPTFLTKYQQELFINGLKSFWHLIPAGKKVSYLKFYEKIKENYSDSNPKTHEVCRLFMSLAMLED